MTTDFLYDNILMLLQRQVSYFWERQSVLSEKDAGTKDWDCENVPVCLAYHIP